MVGHTGTSYTTVLSDSGKMQRCDNTSPFALTIDATQSYAVGSQIPIVQWNTGQVTVGMTGGTLHGTPGLKLRAQYSRADAVLTDAGWFIAGDLSA